MANENAYDPSERCDPAGKEDYQKLSLEEAAIVEECKRRLAKGGPLYSSAEVEARLKKLEEIRQRGEELDEAKVKELLRRMRAGEPV